MNTVRKFEKSVLSRGVDAFDSKDNLLYFRVEERSGMLIITGDTDILIDGLIQQRENPVVKSLLSKLSDKFLQEIVKSPCPN